MAQFNAAFGPAFNNIGVPGSLVLTGVLGNILTWTASTSATSYRVERKIDNLSYIELVTVSSPTLTYTDTTAEHLGELCTYRVYAINIHGETSSNTVSIRMPTIMSQSGLGIIVRSWRTFNNSFRIFAANLTKGEDYQEVLDFESIEETPQYSYKKQYRVLFTVSDLLVGSNSIAVKILGEDTVDREATYTIIREVVSKQVPTIVALPGGFSYTSPASGATNLSRDVQLVWNNSGSYRYSVFLGNSGSPAKVVDQTGLTYPATGTMRLTAGETYSWKVDIHDDSLNQLAEAPIRWFRIARAPGVPTAPIPTNSTIDLDPTSVVLSWTVNNLEGNLLDYDVYFGATTSPIFVATVTTLYYALPLLLSNKTYYWKIVVRDAKGNTVVGPQWKFKTQA